jgi:hypothetical protein
MDYPRSDEYACLFPLTYGLFPLTACSRLWPVPAYGLFPLTACSHLRPVPTYGLFPLSGYVSAARVTVRC